MSTEDRPAAAFAYLPNTGNSIVERYATLGNGPTATRPPVAVHALAQQESARIRFPKLIGYQMAGQLLPILDADPEGSTDDIEFTTTRQVERAEPGRCHVSHIVVDFGWEAAVAGVFEDMRGIDAFTPTEGLGFAIPYSWQGEELRYVPDFLVRLTPTVGDPDLVRTLIVEVSGGSKRDPSPGSFEVKADAARNLWCPAVNAHGGWGLWDYVDLGDPTRAQPPLSAAVQALRSTRPG